MMRRASRMGRSSSFGRGLAPIAASLGNPERLPREHLLPHLAPYVISPSQWARIRRRCFENSPARFVLAMELALVPRRPDACMGPIALAQ